MSEQQLKQQFDECLKKAKEIVQSYRDEAPEGCDPQNTWVAIGVSVGTSVAGAAVSYSGQKKAAKAAQASQNKAFGNSQKYLNELMAGKHGSLEDIFGGELDPEAFLYHPVDIDQSQLDTISGNINAFPSANQLTNMVNPAIWRNDLSRIRSLMPGYDNARDLYLGSTKRLLSGELPFQDVEDVVSNRSGLAGMLGSPGGSRNATLRDLGLSRMDAINQGGSMFQQFIQMAEAISPVSSQMRPQQMMFTPQERLQADILQRSLEQQGRASAAMAEAMPDPAQNAIVNAQMGLNGAALGISYNPGTAGMGMQALGQAISSAGGMFGSIYGMQNGGYGAPAQSLSTGQAPRSVSSTPFNTAYTGPMSRSATPYGGVNVNANNMWNFSPTASPAGGGFSNQYSLGQTGVGPVYGGSALFPQNPTPFNPNYAPSSTARAPYQPYVPTHGYAEAGLNGYGQGWFNNGYYGPMRNW